MADIKNQILGMNKDQLLNYFELWNKHSNYFNKILYTNPKKSEYYICRIRVCETEYNLKLSQIKQEIIDEVMKDDKRNK